MVSNGKIFHKTYANELLKIAEQDLESARVLSAGEKGRHENTLFLTQQAIEKSLKVVLCHHGKEVPFSNDLEAIAVRLGSHPPPHADAMTDLTPYATIRRYEEGRFEITSEDLNTALGMADDILAWARKEVSE